jgi:hypothetical protein
MTTVLRNGFSIGELTTREKAEGLRIAKQIIRKHGSTDRLPALLDLLEEDDFGREWLWALGELWIGFDGPGVHADRVFQEVAERADNIESVIPELMSAEEYAAFQALPEELTIYRGCGSENMYGFSWTLDREIAAKFPFLTRYRSSRPMVLTARIPKSRAAALKLEGNEHEIIVFDYPEEPSIVWMAELLDMPQGLM